MEPMVLALANADVLRWARETAGLYIWVAADKIGVAPEKLQAVEAGEERLSFAQLRAAGRVYRRNVVVFYLDKVPEEAKPVADFRRLPDYEGHPWSPELRLALRRVAYKRDTAARLVEFAAPYDWSYVNSIVAEGDPEQVAAKIRKHLPVPFLERGADEYEIFREWRSAVESRGTLVFLVRHVPVEEMRGLSIARAPFPAIALNRADSPRARLFSLIHELVHVWLGMSSMCDDFLDEYREDLEVRDVEVFCNAVAAAVLMPASAVRNADVVRLRDAGTKWAEGELKQLAAPFGVSAEAMLRRLLTLGLASKENYEALRREWLKRPLPPERESSAREKGFEIALRTQGVTYVRLVLDALGGEAISLSEVSDFLDMKLNHLPALEAAVASVG